MGSDDFATRSSLGAAALSVVVMLLLGTWTIYPSPFVPIFYAALPIALVIALARPFFICLLFIAFAFFRIHEICAVLEPFNIPLILAMLVLTTLAWNLALSRAITPYLTPELALFLAFFALVTIGLFLAIDRQLPLQIWSDSFWKIGIMTIAIAWLARTPEDFALAARIWMLGGLFVAVIAISNKVAGIDLVEGGRVKIGTGPLGDPNDLALVLLLPLAFSAAALVYRTKVFDTFLALLTTPMIIIAIGCTQSRGGMLGVLAVLSVIGLRWTKSKFMVLVLVVGVSLGLLFGADVFERFSDGKEISRYEHDESVQGRLDAWAAAIDLAVERPLRGVGLGNFAISHFRWDGVGRNTHSIWFDVLVDIGFPGLVVFVGLIIFCWRRITSSARTLNRLGAAASTRAMALALQAALLGFCVSGSFLSQAFTWPLYIYIALISAVGHYTTILLHTRESQDVSILKKSERRDLYPVPSASYTG